MPFEEWLDLKVGGLPKWHRPNDSKYDFDHFETRPTYAEYVVRTWEDPVGLLVGRYSLDQVGKVMWSEPLVCEDERLPLALRDRAWSALPNIFLTLFAKYSSPVLSHLNEKNSDTDELDGACYMWWDLRIVPYKDQRFFELIEACLQTRHPALQESALHGLGEIAWCEEAHPRIDEIVDHFLDSKIAARPELVKYAKKAQVGQVQ